jgi:hypothetical protein
LGTFWKSKKKIFAHVLILNYGFALFEPVLVNQQEDLFKDIKQIMNRLIEKKQNNAEWNKT